MHSRLARYIVLALAVLVLVATPVTADAPTYNGYPVVNVVVNGNPVSPEVPAIIMDGRTLLPVRAVAQALGTQVTWEPISRTVVIRSQSIPSVSDYNTQIGEVFTSIDFDTTQLQSLTRQMSLGNVSSNAVTDAARTSYTHAKQALRKVLDLTPPDDAKGLHEFAIEWLETTALAFNEVTMALNPQSDRYSDAQGGAVELARYSVAYHNLAIRLYGSWKTTHGFN